MIDFAPALRDQTILLSSQLAIDKSLTITGSVPVTVSGGGRVRIFTVSEQRRTAALAGLTLYNGVAAGDGDYTTDSGGAIFSAGVLTVTHSVVYSSSASSGSSVSATTGGCSAWWRAQMCPVRAAAATAAAAAAARSYSPTVR